MATYVDTKTAADNECTYQGLIRCAACDYLNCEIPLKIMSEGHSWAITHLMFHIEQCVEKFLKAIITHAGQHYPHCSNIRQLEKRVLAIDESLVHQCMHDNARCLSRNAGRQNYKIYDPEQYDVDRVMMLC